MLILHGVASEPEARQGCHAEVLAELQRNPAATVPKGTSQQRLLDLAERLARVQALGDGYARVTFSGEAAGLVRQVTG